MPSRLLEIMSAIITGRPQNCLADAWSTVLWVSEWLIQATSWNRKIQPEVGGINQQACSLDETKKEKRRKSSHFLLQKNTSVLHCLWKFISVSSGFQCRFFGLIVQTIQSCNIDPLTSDADLQQTLQWVLTFNFPLDPLALRCRQHAFLHSFISDSSGDQCKPTL